MKNVIHVGESYHGLYNGMFGNRRYERKVLHIDGDSIICRDLETNEVFEVQMNPEELAELMDECDAEEE